MKALNKHEYWIIFTISTCNEVWEICPFPLSFDNIVIIWIFHYGGVIILLTFGSTFWIIRNIFFTLLSVDLFTWPRHIVLEKTTDENYFRVLQKFPTIPDNYSPDFFYLFCRVNFLHEIRGVDFFCKAFLASTPGGQYTAPSLIHATGTTPSTSFSPSSQTALAHILKHNLCMTGCHEKRALGLCK